MSFFRVSLLLAAIQVTTTTKLNADNIDINVICNNRIDLTSKLDLYVVARCRNGVQFYQRHWGEFQLTIPICQRSCDSYSCHMIQHGNRNVYYMRLLVSTRQSRKLLKAYTVRCSFEKHGRMRLKTTVKLIGAKKRMLTHVTVHISKHIPINLAMRLKDSQGKTVTKLVSAKKRVRLVSEMNDANDTKNIVIQNCYAMVKYKRVLLLRNGCGTGRVFGTNEGFVNRGNTIESPFFKIHRHKGNTSVDTFFCTFKICKSHCNIVNSCAAAKGH